MRFSKPFLVLLLCGAALVAQFRGRSWQPDTCPLPRCWVEEIYSGTSVVGMGQVLRKCSAHANVPDNRLYGVLLTDSDSEQKRKNLIEARFLSTLAATLGATDPETGAIVWKTGVLYNWSFDSERVLRISISGANLTTQQRSAVQTYANTTFGSGKVVIE